MREKTGFCWCFGGTTRLCWILGVRFSNMTSAPAPFQSSLLLGCWDTRWRRWRVCEDPALFVRLSALRHVPGLSAGLFRPPMTMKKSIHRSIQGYPGWELSLREFWRPQFSGTEVLIMGVLEWTFRAKRAVKNVVFTGRGWIEGDRRSEINQYPFGGVISGWWILEIYPG